MRCARGETTVVPTATPRRGDLGIDLGAGQQSACDPASRPWESLMLMALTWSLWARSANFSGSK